MLAPYCYLVKAFHAPLGSNLSSLQRLRTTTVIITCVVESASPRPTRTRKSERRLRRNREGSYTASLVFSSYLVWGWRYRSRWKAVEFRRSIEPDPRELTIGRTNFMRLCRARPFKTFVGHRTILCGRFHGAVSMPLPQRLAANSVDCAKSLKASCAVTSSIASICSALRLSGKTKHEIRSRVRLGRARSAVDLQSLEAAFN